MEAPGAGLEAHYPALVHGDSGLKNYVSVPLSVPILQSLAYDVTRFSCEASNVRLLELATFGTCILFPSHEFPAKL